MDLSNRYIVYADLPTTLFIETLPFGAQRPRVSTRGAKKVARMHLSTPESNRRSELAGVLTQGLSAWSTATRNAIYNAEYVQIDWIAVFPRTQAQLKVRSKTGEYVAGEGRLPKVGKPDEDNIRKVLWDVFKRQMVLRDDASLTQGFGSKVVAAIDEPAGYHFWFYVKPPVPEYRVGVLDPPWYA